MTHFIKQPDGTVHIENNGQPFLFNGCHIGELKENAPELFRHIAKSGFDPICVDILWSDIETSEGVFDFSVIDRISFLANANGLHAVLQWKGSFFRKSESNTCPASVPDTDWESPVFPDDIFQAEKSALLALFDYLKKSDTSGTFVAAIFPVPADFYVFIRAGMLPGNYAGQMADAIISNSPIVCLIPDCVGFTPCIQKSGTLVSSDTTRITQTNAILNENNASGYLCLNHRYPHDNITAHIIAAICSRAGSLLDGCFNASPHADGYPFTDIYPGYRVSDIRVSILNHAISKIKGLLCTSESTLIHFISDKEHKVRETNFLGIRIGFVPQYEETSGLAVFKERELFLIADNCASFFFDKMPELCETAEYSSDGTKTSSENQQIIYLDGRYYVNYSQGCCLHIRFAVDEK